MKVQFVNNYSMDIVGYVGNYPNVKEPAKTGPITKNGGTGAVDVPGGSWTVTVQLAKDPPLGANSPQENVFARTGGISGNYIVIINEHGQLHLSKN
jgi:hypothetical protein